MNAIERAAEALLLDQGLNPADPEWQAWIKRDAAIIKRELEKAVPAKETAMPTCGSGTRAWEKYEFARGHNECRKAFLGE